MINLIKSGAFDSFGDRVALMRQYIESVSDCKKRINLQNMKMLIDFGLIPERYDLECRIYNFNKYLKKFKDGLYYLLDNIAFNFYSVNFDIDKLEPAPNAESNFKIKQLTWDKIYQSHMDIVRPFVKSHSEELLVQVNNRLISDMWDKYCLGTISKWEMDSTSCYVHEHELSKMDKDLYGIQDFDTLPENPVIERMIPIKKKLIPIFVLQRIAGTVLDRDKAKKTVSLLTTSGVVTVKIYGGVFQQYDKQISERGADGKKHVIEKSAFSRGNKIIVTGIRQDDAFLAKVYKSTPYHRVEIISSIFDNGEVAIRTRGEDV